MSSSNKTNVFPPTQISQINTQISSDFVSENDDSTAITENDISNFDVSQIKVKCCVGDLKLNCLLGGGIPTGCVTEVFGESGTGKTELCLQLAACAVKRNGLHGSTIYLHTSPFPVRRLQKLMHTFLGNRFIGPNPLTLVILKQLLSCMDLIHLVDELDGSIHNSYLTEFPVKLIVIDNITRFFSPTYTSNQKEMEARVKVFTNIGNRFDQLAMKWDIAIVFTNDVVDVSNCPGMIARNTRKYLTSGRVVQTGLGVSYGNSENVRVVLTKDELGEVRHFHVIAPSTKCSLIRITDEGLVGE